MELRTGTPDQAGVSPARVRQLAALAERWVREETTPALVVLAARRGIVFLHQAFGQLGPEPDAPPVRLDTIFPLASISKVVTTTAAMMLVEDGLLGLNRPLAEYLPEFVGEGKEKVMVHHLPTHTSGLRDEDVTANVDAKKGRVEVPAPPEGLHARIHERLFLGCDTALWKAPGVEMVYCGFGFTLLGEIVRRVSGQPLAVFARERIFDPLWMQDTHYVVPESVSHRVVRRPAHAPWAEYSSRELQELPSAPGGVYSTAMDMAIFCQTFLNGGRYGENRILSPAAVAEMTRNQIPGIPSRFKDEYFPEAGWGLGWCLEAGKHAWRHGSLRSPGTFGHAGATGVYVWVDPLSEIVGVYFSVTLEVESSGLPLWNADLFMDAVIAAVE